MSRGKELVKNTLVLGLGNFLPKIVAIITLPILTARLTKAEYGSYDLITTMVMLLMPIATLQIQSAAFRFLIDYRGDKKNSSRIITNILLVTLPISMLVCIGFVIFMPSFDLITRVVIGVYFLIDILYLTLAQVARGLDMNKHYSIASIALAIVNGIGIVLSLELGRMGLMGVLLSLLAANIVGLLYLMIVTRLFSYISVKQISKSTIKELVSYSWPMVPNNLSNWVLMLSDRLIITSVLGVAANAVYAVANKIPNLLSMAQAVMVMAWQENASIAVKDKDADKYYTKMFDTIFTFMAGATAMLIGFTPIIFSVLIKGDYADSYVQIPILMLGMFFYCMSSFQGGIYIAHKKTKSVGLTTMAAAAINIVVDIALIYFIGITAGSVSTLVAYFALYIFRIKDSLKFQKMYYNVKKQIVILSIIAVLLVFCFLQNFWLDIFNMLFSVAMFIFLNRKIIIAIFKKVLGKVKK